MVSVGFDLGKRKSQVCIRRPDGSLLERSVETTREALTKLLAQFGKCRVLMESSTSSEWVARFLESCGHEVIVADPNFAQMYAQRRRTVKTDKRDARALLSALELGAYRAAHRCSDEQRRRRAELTARSSLVETRTRYITQLRALFELEGYRVPRSESETVSRKIRAMEIPDDVLVPLMPLVEMIDKLSETIAAIDKKLTMVAKASPVVARLMTVPGVGVVSALYFVAILDDVKRFERARQVSGYLGLVPTENSSAEKTAKGRMTKVGDPRLRAYLVQAAWAFMRSHDARARDLQEWTMAIESRRGKQKAIVALARKLACILYAIWRDDDAVFAPRSHLSVPREMRRAAA